MTSELGAGCCFNYSPHTHSNAFIFKRILALTLDVRGIQRINSGKMGLILEAGGPEVTVEAFCRDTSNNCPKQKSVNWACKAAI